MSNPNNAPHLPSLDAQNLLRVQLGLSALQGIPQAQVALYQPQQPAILQQGHPEAIVPFLGAVQPRAVVPFQMIKPKKQCHLGSTQLPKQSLASVSLPLPPPLVGNNQAMHNPRVERFVLESRKFLQPALPSSPFQSPAAPQTVSCPDAQFQTSHGVAYPALQRSVQPHKMLNEAPLQQPAQQANQAPPLALMASEAQFGPQPQAFAQAQFGPQPQAPAQAAYRNLAPQPISLRTQLSPIQAQPTLFPAPNNSQSPLSAFRNQSDSSSPFLQAPNVSLLQPAKMSRTSSSDSLELIDNDPDRVKSDLSSCQSFHVTDASVQMPFPNDTTQPSQFLTDYDECHSHAANDQEESKSPRLLRDQ